MKDFNNLPLSAMAAALVGRNKTEKEHQVYTLLLMGHEANNDAPTHLSLWNSA